MEQADANALKKELCTSVYDNKYGKIRWIDLYFRDGDHFLIKAKKDGVSSNTISFFEENSQALTYIRDTISIDFFREQQCMELVDRFCSPQKSQASNRIRSNEIKLRSQEEKEKHRIKKISKKQQKIEKQKKKNVRVSYCSSLIEILVLKTRKRELQWNIKSNDNGVQQHIEYATKNLWNREKIKEVILVVELGNNLQTSCLILNRQKKMQISSHDCEYLAEAITSTKHEEQEWERKLKEYRRREEEKRRLEKEKVRKAQEENARRQRQVQEEKTQQKKLSKQLHRQEWKTEKARMLDVQHHAQKSTFEQNESAMNAVAQPGAAERLAQQKKLPQINARDFVVRRSVFKCTHDKHKIENLDATVEIIDKAGGVRLATINAGYCSACKIFFIMESSYEKLKKKGIPICRVSDEKTYLKSSFANGMRLAQESILMQYGYNVNQAEGLTGTRRKRILAVLIDKKIMSRSEIISYLDFFICQRQSNPKFELAISKWEDDRDFVESYRVGEFHQYGVNAIHRR